MPKHSKPGDPETYRRRLAAALENLEARLKDGELRGQVLELVAAAQLLQNIGASLIQGPNNGGAKARILVYMQKHVGVILSGEELMTVAGISEYARRIRELRVEHGWRILTGMTLAHMDPEEVSALFEGEKPKLKPDQYVLLSAERDAEAADRWKIANDVRKEKNAGVRDKILKYFRSFVGKEISGEELRYVSGDKTEWARRTRELRTECGWPILTKFAGRPDLPVGIYVLEKDRQSPEHDRRIPEGDYRRVLARDNYTCRDCGWTHDQWNRSDPRHLEAHHVKHHAVGGSNSADNLITLCNVCHDARHSRRQPEPFVE